jgi:flagellar M-ring protein FliF
MNAPFAKEKISLPEVPLWKQPELQDLLRSFAWPVGTLLFGVLVLLGLVRPALKTMASSRPAVARPGGQLDAIESEEPNRPQLAAPARSNVPTAGELALDDARKLTRENPAAVANIVKTWMNGEAPA